MQAYAASKDTHGFIEGAVALLKGGATVHLLGDLGAYLPRDQRPWFSEVVRTHAEQAQQQREQQQQQQQQRRGQQDAAEPGDDAAAAAAKRAKTAGDPAGGSAAAAAAAAAASTAAAAPPGCCVCSARPADQPFEAPCGHTACWSCWMGVLARSGSCAACGVAVRRRSLVKRHFLT
jgi:hypothetical protein